MDCASEGRRGGTRGGVVGIKPERSGERGVKGGGFGRGGPADDGGLSEGVDCGVAGVVSESRVQPSGSYEYII